MRRVRASWLAVGAVLALACADFVWQLGGSSLYVDEVQSLNVAEGPLSHLLHTLGQVEISPPGYFVLLHEWLGRGGAVHGDWFARVPSAAAGVLLVGVVMWLAALVLPRRRPPVLLAGLLAAISPFVLEHAQRAQPYVFVSLGCAVAAAAALQAEQSSRRRPAWLCLSLAAAILALLCHYLALLAVAPVAAWVASRAELPRAWRIAYPLLIIATVGALVPLAVAQHRHFPHRPGVLGSASLTPRTALQVGGLPFDGRVAPLAALGCALLVCSVVAVAPRVARPAPGHPGLRLVLLIAAGTPLALIVLSAVGGRSFWGHLMLTRYGAAGAPFALVLLAAGAALLPRGAGVGLTVAAVVVAAVGVIDSHRDSGFYLDARGVAAYVREARRPGDEILLPGDAASTLTLRYYGLRARTLARPRRMWLVARQSGGPADAGRRLRTAGYTVLSARSFPALDPVTVFLVRRPSG